MAEATDPITDAIIAEARAGYQQFRDNDPAFLDRLDPDVEWLIPETLPGGGALRGQLAVMEFFEVTAGMWDGAYPDPEEFLGAGDRLVVLGTWRATARATGAHVEVPFAHVFRYRGGKIVYFRNYLDTAMALQALG